MPNLVQDLRQLDGGSTGARHRPEHLGNNNLANIVDLVELPLESTSLFKGLGQHLRAPTDHRLGRLQVLL